MARRTPEQLAEELRDLTIALKRHARADATGDALPYAQVSVMKRIEADGPATSADLARGEAMTPQSMGELVIALEEAGLVTRRDDAKHGRKRYVSLTAAGRKALAANRAGRLERTARVLGQFSADEQQTLAAAFALLRKAFIS